MGLFEMSLIREAGKAVTWLALFDVMKPPRSGWILMLKVFSLVIFLVWIMLADLIYGLTMGSDMTVSHAAFLKQVLTTPAGQLWLS